MKIKNSYIVKIICISFFWFCLVSCNKSSKFDENQVIKDNKYTKRLEYDIVYIKKINGDLDSIVKLANIIYFDVNGNDTLTEYIGDSLNRRKIFDEKGKLQRALDFGKKSGLIAAQSVKYRDNEGKLIKSVSINSIGDTVDSEITQRVNKNLIVKKFWKGKDSTVIVKITDFIYSNNELLTEKIVKFQNVDTNELIAISEIRTIYKYDNLDNIIEILEFQQNDTKIVIEASQNGKLIISSSEMEKYKSGLKKQITYTYNNGKPVFHKEIEKTFSFKTETLNYYNIKGLIERIEEFDENGRLKNATFIEYK